ncbi:MAG: hypothetical protein GF330_07205 [Candidatus Eisenbacteria bacterium]|nr:hypothetical protein [Candidatus Eisenbacteria bacterium]
MGPLSFLNGAFLMGLAAAALPILIHLLSRRRARDLPFSHTEFLDEITRRKVRRMKLRQWLLLLLRTLAVACLALALSQPVWQGPGARAQRGSSTIAILIDDSFSMEASLDPGQVLPIDATESDLSLATRFEEARQRALQVVDLLEEGDRALLVFMAEPVRVPYESSVRDPSLLREELRRARPRAARADWTGAFERVRPLLSGAHTLNREIFVISDFQQNQIRQRLRAAGRHAQAAGRDSIAGRLPAETGAVDGVRRGAESGAYDGAESGAEGGADRSQEGGAESGAESVRPSLLPVPEETHLYLLPVRSTATRNVALRRAIFERDPASDGGAVIVQAHNHGRQAIDELALQVLRENAGRELLAEGFLDLAGEAAAQARIAIPTAVAADDLLTIRSAPDLLERDNLRHLAAGATSRFRVLVVTGGPLGDPEIRDEARFPILALDPARGPRLLEEEPARGEATAPVLSGTTQLFDLVTISESDLGLQERIEADVVLLLNVGRISAAAAELLEHFHAEGGGVLIAVGDRVDARTYNTQILARLGGMRLTNLIGADPAAEAETSASAHFSLRPAVVGHPIFEGFPLAPGQALSSARFERLLGVRPGPQARVLAEFSGGHPALVAEPGLLLFSSALDLSWSDFPSSAAYLPFLHRAVMHLVLGGRAGEHDPLVGDRLRWPLPSDLAPDALRCLGPGDIEVPITVSPTERGPVLVTDAVTEPGFYRLRAEGGVAFPAIAVNVDPRESDLTAMTVAEGRTLFGDEAVRIEPGAELGRQVLEARFGRELWRFFLILAFLLLVVESLLARGRVLA